MISIIISSKDLKRLSEVAGNIRATIGVPFEIIPTINTEGKMGVCEVYNKGAQQSKFSILCFMHEDIQMHTQDWGQILVKILSDRTIGLVGIAGSISRVDFPAPWGGYWPHWRSNVIQHHKDREADYLEFNPKHETCSDVAVIDGCWMSCRRETWERHRFDAQTFRGFHFYDEDFSLQIFQDARVCVTFEITLEHFSEGAYNQEWFAAAEVFYEKWKSLLPILITNRGRVSIRRARREAFEALWHRLKKMGYSRKELLVVTFRHRRILQELISAFVHRSLVKLRQIIISLY